MVLTGPFPGRCEINNLMDLGQIKKILKVAVFQQEKEDEMKKKKK